MSSHALSTLLDSTKMTPNKAHLCGELEELLGELQRVPTVGDLLLRLEGRELGTGAGHELQHFEFV